MYRSIDIIQDIILVAVAQTEFAKGWGYPYQRRLIDLCHRNHSSIKLILCSEQDRVYVVQSIQGYRYTVNWPHIKWRVPFVLSVTLRLDYFWLESRIYCITGTITSVDSEKKVES